MTIAPVLERRPFGSTGLEVTPLGFGGAEIGALETDRTQVGRLLNGLLDRGVNLLDTAAMYRESEAVIGATVAHRRSEYILVSKCGTEVPDIDEPKWSPHLIAGTVDRALKRLKTDHLDVMLLHSCPLDVLVNSDAIETLVRARDAGKIRHVGYSGDNEAAAWAARHPDIAVIQTSINICDQVNINLGLRECLAQGVGVMIKRPLANAAWRDASEQPGSYKTYASEYTRRLGAMGITPESCGFDGSWGEFALRFGLSQPGVHVAIIGTQNPDHIDANVAAASRGPLPDKVVAHVREAFARAELAAGESWEGRQ